MTITRAEELAGLREIGRHRRPHAGGDGQGDRARHDHARARRDRPRLARARRRAPGARSSPTTFPARPASASTRRSRTAFPATGGSRRATSSTSTSRPRRTATSPIPARPSPCRRCSRSDRAAVPRRPPRDVGRHRGRSAPASRWPGSAGRSGASRDKNGYTLVRNLASHGVGRSLHEEPTEIATWPDAARAPDHDEGARLHRRAVPVAGRRLGRGGRRPLDALQPAARARRCSTSTPSSRPPRGAVVLTLPG